MNFSLCSLQKHMFGYDIHLEGVFLSLFVASTCHKMKKKINFASKLLYYREMDYLHQNHRHEKDY